MNTSVLVRDVDHAIWSLIVPDDDESASYSSSPLLRAYASLRARGVLVVHLADAQWAPDGPVSHALAAFTQQNEALPAFEGTRVAKQRRIATSQTRRTLLWRAAHNAVEVALLSCGYLRLGHAYHRRDGLRCDASIAQVGPALVAFFHIAPDPTLKAFACSDSSRLSSTSPPLRLSPHGLPASLVPPSAPEDTNSSELVDTTTTTNDPNDPNRALDNAIIQDWCRFYPGLQDIVQSDSRMVNVQVEGITMRYPAALIFTESSSSDSSLLGPPENDPSASFSLSTSNSTSSPVPLSLSLIRRYRQVFWSCVRSQAAHLPQIDAVRPIRLATHPNITATTTATTTATLAEIPATIAAATTNAAQSPATLSYLLPLTADQDHTDAQHTSIPTSPPLDADANDDFMSTLDIPAVFPSTPDATNAYFDDLGLSPDLSISPPTNTMTTTAVDTLPTPIPVSIPPVRTTYTPDATSEPLLTFTPRGYRPVGLTEEDEREAEQRMIIERAAEEKRDQDQMRLLTPPPSVLPLTISNDDVDELNGPCSPSNDSHDDDGDVLMETPPDEQEHSPRVSMESPQHESEDNDRNNSLALLADPLALALVLSSGDDAVWAMRHSDDLDLVVDVEPVQADPTAYCACECAELDRQCGTCRTEFHLCNQAFVRALGDASDGDDSGVFAVQHLLESTMRDGCARAHVAAQLLLAQSNSEMDTTADDHHANGAPSRRRTRPSSHVVANAAEMDVIVNVISTRDVDSTSVAHKWPGERVEVPPVVVTAHSLPPLVAVPPKAQDQGMGLLSVTNYMQYEESLGKSVAVSPLALRHWSQLKLGPYGGTKRISAFCFVAYEQSRIVHSAVARLLTEIECEFAEMRLGEHRTIRNYRVNLSETDSAEAMIDMLAQKILDFLNKEDSDRSFTCIYIVSPLQSETFSSTSHSNSQLPHQLQQQSCARDALLRRRLLARLTDNLKASPSSLCFRILTMREVLQAGALQMARKIALGTYASNRTHLSSPLWWSGDDAEWRKNEVQIFSPVTVLASIGAAQDDRSTGNHLQSFNGTSRLHCCYAIHPTHVSAVVTDAHGALMEPLRLAWADPSRPHRSSPHSLVVSSLSDAIKRIWRFCLRLMRETTLQWRVFIERVGTISEPELKYWKEVLKEPVQRFLAQKINCKSCTYKSTPACLTSTHLISMQSSHRIQLTTATTNTNTTTTTSSTTTTTPATTTTTTTTTPITTGTTADTATPLISRDSVCPLTHPLSSQQSLSPNPLATAILSTTELSSNLIAFHPRVYELHLWLNNYEIKPDLSPSDELVACTRELSRLSWLTCTPSTVERRSNLPLHMFILAHL